MFPLDNLKLTIDDIYKKLLDKLTSEGKIIDVSKYLLAQKDNDKRVFYVYDFIKSYSLIPLVIKTIKCEFVSTYYRNLGNQFYLRQEIYEAWQYFNLAMMYAPLQADSYALAISNRSAVFAALHDYKACLEDIRMVFNLPYPVRIREKLVKRKVICEKAIEEMRKPDGNEEAQIDEIFTFKGPANETYLSASSKLEVKYTAELGRHVVAKKFIEVGEIIVQEDPFTSLLLKSQFLFCCAYCLSWKPNLYPCPFCCLTMYCSRPCLEKAWEGYHNYECPLIASLVKMKYTKLELLALRTTIRARNDFESWESAFNNIAVAEASVGTDHWGHVSTDEGRVYDSKSYSAIHTLATNVEKRDVSDIFQKTVSAAVLMHCLGVANFAKTDNLPLKKQIKSFIAKTLLTHLMTAPTNMHGISANAENEDGNFVEEYSIGSAPYAFLSLINHSCAPNVVRYSRLGKTQMSLIAIRPIRKGMEILDNYGYDEVIRHEEDTNSQCALLCKPGVGDLFAELAAPGRPKQKVHHAVHTRDERQAILKSQYKFTCLCEACVEDWPLYQSLNTIPSLPPDTMSKIDLCLNGDALEALQKADKKLALELYKPLCELALALEPYIPSKEVAECQEALKQCLSIFSGVLPKGFTKLVDWDIPPPDVPGQSGTSRFYTGQGASDLL